MSRTYRRKNVEETWAWYKTEEEFNHDRDNIISSDEVKRRIVKLHSLFPDEFPLLKFTEEDNKIRAELMKDYRAYVKSVEWAEVNATSLFKRVSSGKNSYKEYCDYKKAIYHSDASYQGSVPGWFNNLFFERPMRRSVKRSIKYALTYDTLDEMICDESTNGGAWLYW